eukprot:7491714-Pyramimonas_sp.AAC.1
MLGKTRNMLLQLAATAAMITANAADVISLATHTGPLQRPLQKPPSRADTPGRWGEAREAIGRRGHRQLE